ncbi:MAG: 3,4-dihydroxyphenylacetate 2,3-dioxygenase [Armatimonadota bacterium]|nr:3,4-dihydroxyphenylacetate 2,3-dioxygenase [Armatimonadota bacterium]MDR7440270.1 3,4-dihydroxyphenylacetate 2,3-dioxygenase [Armatimonadota bacterium]MDR7443833.1 3,4-dihydroxyphenylacetate 2,3-dioxygenase [Armatimonadota bacterium]MDR7568998.1 3,4-dihydroxyphenylacetate 2,3-dioxygenase [Armatimonadota bacterium]MDR7613887.1 3,4-dihydroxyphenylacetate 2,3-dioxygenase [Armatimonadota bacterium]
MEIRAPRVVRAGHVVLYVSDLQAARRFYVELLGFSILHEGPDALYLRGYEEREWSLKLQLHPRPGLRHIAFKVAEEKDLDSAIEMAKGFGLPWREEEEFERPHMVRIQDPFGFPVAFYRRSSRHPPLLQEYHRYRGPGIQRLDHFNLFSPKVPEVVRFYMDVLGFRLTEYTVDDHDQLWGAWLQRKGNVHDLALTSGPGPRLHHIGYWVQDVHGILRAADILASARCVHQLERGPGRHGISNAMFLYLRDPDGHRVELYTSDYLTVDPEFEPVRWHLRDPRRQTLWGQAAPESWFQEGSAVEGFTGQFVEPSS